LQATGWRFDAGHRIRLALAGSDWPTVWPLPTREPIAIRLSSSTPCTLVLPGLPSDARPFEVVEPPPYEPDAGGWENLERPSSWRIVTDAMSGASGIEASDASESRHAEDGVRTTEERRYRAFVNGADPLDARVDGSATFRLERPGLSVRSRAWGEFGCTAETFTYDVHLEVRSNGERFARRRWRGSVDRRLC
jgi:hypothetical protein